MKILRASTIALLLFGLLLWVGCGGGGSSNSPAQNPNPQGPTALMDMTASQTYVGYHGGLYENSTFNMPSDHLQGGTNALAQVQPLDPNGTPNPNGKVVFLGMGMSHVFYEFGDFMTSIQGNPMVNLATMVPVNGGQLGKTACFWAVPHGNPVCDPPDPAPPCAQAATNNAYDIVRDCYLTPAHVTEQQVQVAWLKQADKEPAVNGLTSMCNPAEPNCTMDDNTDALHYERLLGDILRSAKIRYPNLKQVFISSRSYGGYATIPLNPEPFAYENGFAVKWLIQAQIDQARSNNTVVDPVAGDLNYDSTLGPVTVPWVAWGPYLWADGIHPRSDGLIWCDGQPGPPCNGEADFRLDDHTHPSPAGEAKVTQLLLKFFMNSPLTPWFRP